MINHSNLFKYVQLDLYAYVSWSYGNPINILIPLWSAVRHPINWTWLWFCVRLILVHTNATCVQTTFHFIFHGELNLLHFKNGLIIPFNFNIYRYNIYNMIYKTGYYFWLLFILYIKGNKFNLLPYQASFIEQMFLKG